MDSECSVTRLKLEGRVVIITGGASGIGEASVRLFVHHGAFVVIADIQDGKGAKLVEELGDQAVLYKHCDVSKEEEVEALIKCAVEKWGKLDVMFSNAGILGSSITHEVSTMDIDDFDHVMSINARGMALCVKHASKAMILAKTRGSIICTCSVASMTGGLASVAYTMSKHAIVGLMRAAASELGKHGIRVNCISPTGVVTPLAVSMMQQVTSNPYLTKEEIQHVIDETSSFAGHSLTALDIAKAALFLASEDASFVSGHNLVVDGGFTASSQGVTK